MSTRGSARDPVGPAGPGLAWRLAALVLKGLAFALMLAVPLLGTWSASSLAAFWNGPIAVTTGAGLLLFPILPLAWEGLGELRRRRAERETKKPPRARILTFGDRMILRTLLLNGSFLAVFLVGWPQAIFTALSTRGDWFLEDVEGADGARRMLLGAADAMEWLYEAANDNPYASAEDREDEGGPTPTAGDGLAARGDADADADVDADADAEAGAEAGAGTGAEAGADADAGAGTGADADADADAVADADAAPAPSPPPAPSRTWPFSGTVHPAVVAIPASEEASIAAVGAYLRAEVDDPFERAKAVHDYVATRIAYDVPALTGHRPPQDAEHVFETHAGVCEGYARLFRALGDRAGLEVRYVVGDARDAGDPANGEPHAWNAVRIDGGWYLVDPTWDAGTVEGQTFTARYSSMYFLTSPEVFGVDHFPDDRVWQLRDRPISRGEFHRQPILSPRFHADGFRLEQPDRSQVEVEGAFDARIASDARAFLLASLRPHGTRAEGTRCEIEGDRTLSVHCPIATAGTYDVVLFSSPVQYGTYWSIGSLQVVRR